MYSLWEKIQGGGPPCQVGFWVEDDMAPLPDHRPCEKRAEWIHSWETEQSGRNYDYYCEPHALEHGLSSYEAKPELVMEADRKKMLAFIEQQSQETLIPYGGSRAEEATMFEDEEEDV